MGEVRDLAERAWRGELSETQVHPATALVGFEELTADLGFMSAFSNACVVDTDDGLVMIDTSSMFHADALFEGVRSWSPKPLRTAVYTHGHVDHVFGLRPFESEVETKGWARIEVLAHELCPPRFDRYQLTNGYNGIINQRQFGFPKPIFPREFRYPDRTMRDTLELDVGGVRIDLRHDRGETDDHIWAWLPAQRAIYSGDLFIWAAPNCGNPQKVQRYPREWASALRRMAAMNPEILMPGHGPPIIGGKRVALALDETARLLETICEQTLGMMNQGARLNEILHSVVVPDELLARPYLRPSYDDPMFIVRNLWRLYGGWYDGNPAHLKPARDADLARAVAALAGGAAALAHAAEQHAARGDLPVAGHLAELAVQAEPSDRTAHGVRAAICRARAEKESSLMARGVFGAAARESEKLAAEPTGPVTNRP